MTPKEKAKELIVKYIQYTPVEEAFEALYAKQCALIAIDEILKELDAETWGLEMYEAFNRQSYWQEVKQEIEKL